MLKDTFTMRKSTIFHRGIPNVFQVLVPHSFGPGVSKTAGERLAGIDCKKTLVLFDKGVEAAGITTGIVDCVKAAGLDVVTCNWVEPDPSDTIIDKITAFATEENVDSIVAVGGGSALDSGKAVKMYLNKADSSKNIALITIPTTSGTGAELTKSVVITESATGKKKGAGGYETMADLALVDPELTLGVPPKVTAACAFDVMAHAIESTTSVFNEPVHEILALEAVRLVKENIVECVENGKNLEARSNMHLASTLAGISIGNGNTTIGHVLAHAVGAVHHIPHGVCCAIFTPACLEYVAEPCAKVIRKYADILDVAIDANDDAVVVARKVSEAIFALANKVNIPTITEYFTDVDSACEEITNTVLNDPGRNNCVRTLDEAGVRWILSRTFELAKG